MDLKHRIGLRVRAIRQQRGLTQEDLAALIERSVDAISNMERGRYAPNVETLSKLAEGLGIELAELLDSKDRRLSATRVALASQLVEATRHLTDRELAVAVEQVRVLAAHSLRRRPAAAKNKQNK